MIENQITDSRYYNSDDATNNNSSNNFENTNDENKMKILEN